MAAEVFFDQFASAFVVVAAFLLGLGVMAEIGGARSRRRKATAIEQRTIKAVTYTPPMIRDLILADFSAKEGLSDFPAEGQHVIVQTEGVALVHLRMMHPEGASND